MAAPTYKQVTEFGIVQRELLDAAENDFLRSINKNMTDEEIMEQAAKIAAKFRLLGQELGAQWYDLCAELAGIEAEPAEVQYVDYNETAKNAEIAYQRIPKGESVTKYFSDFISNQIISSIREVGDTALWRDYYRGIEGGRWARVPVGETCAWCLMLASQGAWYLTKESALGEYAGHYHKGCNCIAVYYANPESIAGYGATLGKYKDYYYSAEKERIANEKGIEPYSDYLQQRIDRAKAEHQKHNEELKAQGEKPIPWTVYNEDLIIMRERYGLK